MDYTTKVAPPRAPIALTIRAISGQSFINQGSGFKNESNIFQFMVCVCKKIFLFHNFVQKIQNQVTHDRGSLFRAHLARCTWATFVGHLWVTLRFLCVGHFGPLMFIIVNGYNR